jgi:hypothetical protein
MDIAGRQPPVFYLVHDMTSPSLFSHTVYLFLGVRRLD